jgi:copper oxidase (laccase) domain-containing protein
MQRASVEQFAPLSGLPGIVHAFTQRVPGLDVQVDREIALNRLDEHHAAARVHLGLQNKVLVTANQVHGADVTVVTSESAVPVPYTDGLITKDPSVCLGIYVADCCAVYLVDPAKRVIALLHSGRKGTEQAISKVAVEKMHREFGSEPPDIVALLGPCIRPPHYEVDFSRQIAAQLRTAGVRDVHDSGACTASDPSRYYSYRMEKGKTGRMLALLALD